MNKRAILIPIKDFDSAKLRLSEVLDTAGRAKLAKELARGVIEACSGVPVWIVCENDEVESWGRGLGAEILRNPEEGLNKAVEFGFNCLRKSSNLH